MVSRVGVMWCSAPAAQQEMGCDLEPHTLILPFLRCRLYSGLSVQIWKLRGSAGSVYLTEKFIPRIISRSRAGSADAPKSQTSNHINKAPRADDVKLARGR